jgi:hypothetical protein
MPENAKSVLVIAEEQLEANEIDPNTVEYGVAKSLVSLKAALDADAEKYARKLGFSI